MMGETQILWTIGNLSVTVYGALLACGALLGLLLTLLLASRRGKADAGLSAALCGGLGALLGGRIVYCLTMLDTILVDLGGAGFILRLWEGGYALYGAVFGGLLGIWLYARATGQDAAELLDLCAPGAALPLLFGRAAEYFTTQGLGHYLENEAFFRFPFAVQNEWEEWQQPVFVYEAFAALVILIVCLLVLRKGRPGRTAEAFIVLLGMTQILLDSFREDDFIRFGFVHFNQLAAAISCLWVLVRSLRRARAEQGKLSGKDKLRVALFFLGVGIVVGIEFALDKTPVSNALLYALMAATLVMMGVAVWKE